MGFSIQESIISSIYIVATVRLLGAVYYMRTRQTMFQLLGINLICIAMDMILIGLEFSDNYVAEASVKPLIYAIKLKLEFAVYSQLVGFTKATFEERARERLSSASDYDEPAPRPQYNSPADFFKTIPKVLKKPTVPTHPTIHTHPEQFIKGSDRFDFARWDSSQVELSPKILAWQQSARGGEGGTAAPQKARELMGNPPDDSGPRIVNRSKSRAATDRRELSRTGSETSAAGWSHNVYNNVDQRLQGL